MFNIKLIDEYGDIGNVDLLESANEIKIAEEALLITSSKLDITTTALENIEDTIMVSDNIASTGDESTAVMVANEVLRQNLKFLGSEHRVNDIITGTESITVANEGIKDTLKAAWEKVKAFLIKVWEWVVRLLGNIKNFFLNLIGKGDTTYERLVKLTKRLKDKKLTELGDAKFSESTQKAINEKMKLLSLNKGIDEASVILFLDYVESGLKFEYDKRDRMLESAFKRFETLSRSKKISTEMKNTTDDFMTLIPNLISGSSTLKSDIKVVNVGKQAIKDDEIKDAFDDLNIDHEGCTITLAGVDFAKLHCVALYITSDGKEAFDDVTKSVGKDEVEKSVKAMNKVLKNIKVTSFTVEPDKAEYEDKYEDIKPLTFNEIESIRDAMKDVDKITKKVIEKQDTEISKEKKDVENAIKKESDEYEKNDVMNLINNMGKSVIKIRTNIAKEVAKGLLVTSKALLISPVWDYCSESSKLYKKED
jgi:hypothetical protein